LGGGGARLGRFRWLRSVVGWCSGRVWS
jgi:hypothetical protein